MSATHARPDFSGVWSLNISRSTLRVEIPKKILVKIQHREPNITQNVLVTFAAGPAAGAHPSVSNVAAVGAGGNGASSSD